MEWKRCIQFFFTKNTKPKVFFSLWPTTQEIKREKRLSRVQWTFWSVVAPFSFCQADLYTFFKKYYKRENFSCVRCVRVCSTVTFFYTYAWFLHRYLMLLLWKKVPVQFSQVHFCCGAFAIFCGVVYVCEKSEQVLFYFDFITISLKHKESWTNK